MSLEWTSSIGGLMIIAAGRGKLRQISLQGHQGPLAHLYFHSHTPSLCYTHRDTHTITLETVEKEGMYQERKKKKQC